MRIRPLLLLAVLLSLATNALAATVFTNLYEFSPLHEDDATGATTNFDGADAEGGVILSGNTLYGAALQGGTNGTGAIFKINTDGTAFSVLHAFNDAGTPVANLILSGNYLYGTTENGGTNNDGSVFKIGVDGSNFETLYSFSAVNDLAGTNADGANPEAGLVLAGSSLFGTATGGGTNGNGTIFRINTDGTGFTNLYTFSALVANPGGTRTNGDGAFPAAALTLQDGILYGTAEFGGAGGSGTVFAMATNGTAFTNLYSFSTQTDLENSDGAYPVTGVACAGGELFGTTLNGGTNGNGTLFALDLNDGSFTNLHIFSSATDSMNLDGAQPATTLALSGGTLYGTTEFGGSGSVGTIFSVSTNGANFAALYNFTPIALDPSLGAFTNNDGASPQGALVLSGNSIYGAALNGGTGGSGGLYVLSLGPIPLNLQTINHAMVLTWGNPAFSLLSATNANGTYAVVPGADSPYTNNFPLPKQFFSLQGP